MIDLSGKTILVTGASRGIGAATALALDHAGARVVLTYSSSAAKAQEVAASCTNDPVVLQVDLAQPGAASELFDKAIDQVGSIDVVVNNAGIAPTADIDATDQEWADAWQTTMQVNLFSLADICRKAISHFVPNGGGTIINIASRAAFRGDEPNMMHYAASKGAVVSLSRSIARGYGKDGVIAHTSQPGLGLYRYGDRFLRGQPGRTRWFPAGRGRAARGSRDTPSPSWPRAWLDISPAQPWRSTALPTCVSQSVTRRQDRVFRGSATLSSCRNVRRWAVGRRGIHVRGGRHTLRSRSQCAACPWSCRPCG